MSKRSKTKPADKCADGESKSQWIMLLNKKSVEKTRDIENRPAFCQLKHPKTDGSLHITTPVDPIFLILPYLITSSKSGKFMQLEQILHDSDYPACTRLCSCHGTSDLELVADVKGEDDFRAYRFNKDSALSWLKAKVHRVSERLKQDKISLSESQVSTYVKTSNSSEYSDDDYVTYAFGMVSHYLPAPLSEDLKNHLDIKEPVHEKPELENEPATKRVKLENNNPTEDYSKQFTNVAENKKATKMTTAQKKLDKVDKKGMKNISSFFSPKAAVK